MKNGAVRGASGMPEPCGRAWSVQGRFVNRQVAGVIRVSVPFRPNAHAGAGGMLPQTRLGPRAGGSDDRPSGKGPSVGDEERGSRPRALGPPRQMARGEGGPVASGRKWRTAPRHPTRHRVNPRTMVFNPVRRVLRPGAGANCRLPVADQLNRPPSDRSLHQPRYAEQPCRA
jgi:hypothetical protein